jgi:hypothetical protein
MWLKGLAQFREEAYVWVEKRVIGFGVRGSMMQVMIRHVGLEARMFLGGYAKNEYFKEKCRYPVLRGYFQNLVELVKVRMRILTRAQANV